MPTEETGKMSGPDIILDQAQDDEQSRDLASEQSKQQANATRKMSRAEAGRKGGLSTKKRYGDNYFSEIGRMGGKKGGEATKQRYGIEFYQQIGRKGGSR
jgi:general stress protein YciG